MCRVKYVLAGLVAAVLLLSLPGVAFAAAEGAPHLDGGQMSLLWVIPFAGILLSIAIFPLIAPEFWHHHFGKIAAFWGIAFLAPFYLEFGFDLTLYEVLHVALLEYIPFIILLLALFTVAGGIRLKGSLVGTPIVNTGMLLIGTFLASWTGTTGAAMLLIRPLLRANEGRDHQVHVVVFFIFLVANVGGSLTPLGDPPLFLGFLKGVPFFWPTTHMFLPMLLVAAVLLVVFFALDHYLWQREKATGDEPALSTDEDEFKEQEKLGLEGKVNFLLLGGIVAAVLMSGVWKPGISIDVFYVPVELQNLARDLLLIGIALLSVKLTDQDCRDANGFSWFPIIEVAKLFAGIFLTIVPAIAILKAGSTGALGFIVDAVSQNGEPNNVMYFWLTGILSSFLDNAPTYLVFFNTAGGDPVALTGPLASTLLAISAGAVFMGANTYIGNAPNFMVKAIAEERGVRMPSFFGYMAWSVGILVPVFILVTFVFFV
ncbi:MAG: sodium:proton antiporter [Alphaproteobacteria bacterium]|nr:sodium:proton antiporter [Alphaproteobacteria bacterium]MBU0795861.1 sodium:proton antiporter [Alphaproteobacteria bacterium]MBU0887963.1 sodium:proton antiporter [Alphaproteobacteria bacterium]MBU1814814.1 sodium:proton antiporter [Alphaproteobacteria bacterium]